MNCEDYWRIGLALCERGRAVQGWCGSRCPTAPRLLCCSIVLVFGIWCDWGCSIREWKRGEEWERKIEMELKLTDAYLYKYRTELRTTEKKREINFGRGSNSIASIYLPCTWLHLNRIGGALHWSVLPVGCILYVPGRLQLRQRTILSMQENKLESQIHAIPFTRVLRSADSSDYIAI